MISSNKKYQIQRPSNQIRNVSIKTLNQLIAAIRVNISKSKFFTEQIE
jgi:hypothetical protein